MHLRFFKLVIVSSNNYNKPKTEVWKREKYLKRKRDEVEEEEELMSLKQWIYRTIRQTSWWKNNISRTFKSRKIIKKRKREGP